MLFIPRLYINFLYSNYSLINSLGLENLLLLCSSLQSDHEAFLTQGPTALKYGNTDQWKQSSKRVGSLFGQKSPTKTLELKNLSAPVSDRRPPDTNEALSAGRKRSGSKKPIKTLIKAFGTEGISVDFYIKEYQSYPHKANSCYITAPMEVLYASYIRAPAVWSKYIEDLPEGDGMKKIWQSFLFRKLAEGSNSNNIKSELCKVISHNFMSLTISINIIFT